MDGQSARDHVVPSLEAAKADFLDAYNKNVTRAGAKEFLEWLESTDFFMAPASTRFHLARPGGLVEHSVNVYNRLRSLYKIEKTKISKQLAALTSTEEESIAICGLLHDVCKANFYDVEMRNRKDANGNWERYPFYVVNDQFPYGHGEKSVFLIAKHMELSTEESMSIRWHMGGFDDAVMGGSRASSDAFRRYPLAVLTHLADVQASYLDESGEE